MEKKSEQLCEKCKHFLSGKCRKGIPHLLGQVISCGTFEVMTNGDAIRAMTDEALVDVIGCPFGIARVFPTKTSMTPTDSLAFFGSPTLDAIAAEPDEVHISVTFSWDLEKADELYYQWEMLGVPVEVGGPAFGDRMSETFTPGMYLREGW